MPIIRTSFCRDGRDETPPLVSARTALGGPWKQQLDKHGEDLLLQSGPLPVISKVITPFIGVITPVTHLLGHLQG